MQPGIEMTTSPDRLGLSRRVGVFDRDEQHIAQPRRVAISQISRIEKLLVGWDFRRRRILRPGDGAPVGGHGFWDLLRHGEPPCRGRLPGKHDHFGRSRAPDGHGPFRRRALRRGLRGGRYPKGRHSQQHGYPQYENLLAAQLHVHPSDFLVDTKVWG